MKIKFEPFFLLVEEAEKLEDAKAEIVSEAVEETTEIDGEKKQVYRCRLTLAQDNREVIWTPNQRSLKNLVDEYGDESKDWVGKIVELKIEKSSRGQKMIVAHPAWWYREPGFTHPLLGSFCFGTIADRRLETLSEADSCKQIAAKQIWGDELAVLMPGKDQPRAMVLSDIYPAKKVTAGACAGFLSEADKDSLIMINY